MAAFSQAATAYDDSSGLREVSKAASFSEQEAALLADSLGHAKDANEFHQQLAKYKEFGKVVTG